MQKSMKHIAMKNSLLEEEIQIKNEYSEKNYVDLKKSENNMIFRKCFSTRKKTFFSIGFF